MHVGKYSRPTGIAIFTINFYKPDPHIFLMNNNPVSINTFISLWKIFTIISVSLRISMLNFYSGYPETQIYWTPLYLMKLIRNSPQEISRTLCFITKKDGIDIIFSKTNLWWRHKISSMSRFHIQVSIKFIS